MPQNDALPPTQSVAQDADETIGAAADSATESTTSLDGGSPEALLPEVYLELRAIAEARLRTSAPHATLHPTDLLHEAYLRIARSRDASFESKRHFVAAAALAMRSVLVDRARARETAKRGSGFTRIDFDALPITLDRAPEEVLAVDAALARLESVDSRSARVVVLRFYLGLGEVEIAQALGLTERTVRRDWTFARLWLERELSRQRPETLPAPWTNNGEND